MILSIRNRLSDFEVRFLKFKNGLLNGRCEIVIAGDFNGSAVEWGMLETDARGDEILDLTARLDLAVLNVGKTTTFRSLGYSQTIPDVSLATEDLAARIIDWQVLKDFSTSDHHYFFF